MRAAYPSLFRRYNAEQNHMVAAMMPRTRPEPRPVPEPELVEPDLPAPRRFTLRDIAVLRDMAVRRDMALVSGAIRPSRQG